MKKSRCVLWAGKYGNKKCSKACATINVPPLLLQFIGILRTHTHTHTQTNTHTHTYTHTGRYEIVGINSCTNARTLSFVSI